jgi:hypothetical protein
MGHEVKSLYYHLYHSHQKIIITSTLNHNHLYLLIKFIVTHTTTTTILHKMNRCDFTCIWTMHQLSTKHRNYSWFIKMYVCTPKYGWFVCFTVRNKIFSLSIQDHSFFTHNNMKISYRTTFVMNTNED